MPRELHIVSIVALSLAVACSDEGPIELPAECVYSAEYGCVSCDKAFGEQYQIGCSGDGNCEPFCGALPQGYTQCDVYNPPHQCAGFIPPGGRLAACTVGTENSGAPYYLPGLACPPFCYVDSFPQIERVVRDEAGACYVVGASCLPNDVTSVTAPIEELASICNNYYPPGGDAGPSDG